MEKRSSPTFPAGSVALALAFLNLGPEDPAQPFGRLTPGDANRQIAQKLESMAEHFSLVLTQQAVADALADPTHLADGTPVHQMHRHCEVPVYTFAALQCALDRLPPGDWPLIVIAHPRHLRRVRMGLSALAGERRIVYVASGPVCYQDDHWFRPFYWTLKNGLGWLVDGLLVASRRWGLAEKLLQWPLGLISAHPRCPQEARLDPIDI
jgi:hypothetical protein